VARAILLARGVHASLARRWRHPARTLHHGDAAARADPRGLRRRLHFEFSSTLQTIEIQPTPVSPGTPIEFQPPDLYGRPWAKVWEPYFEKGMSRPKEEEVSFDFSK
jgi:hypothetical protein